MRFFEISEIQHLRSIRTQFGPEELLQRKCDPEVNRAFQLAFEKALENYDQSLDYATFGRWIKTQSFATALFEYVEPMLDRTLIADHVVASVLGAIYDFPDLRICANASNVILQDDKFDTDGLLIVSDCVNLCDEGASVGKYFLPYDPYLSCDSHGGSLIKDLKIIREGLSDQLSHIAVRIDHAIWTLRDYYRQSEKRARVYGPPEIVPENLLNPHFPETATGTLTQYMRTCTDSKWLTWSYDIERLEVFWVRRDNQKILEIEEVVPLTAKEFESKDFVSNRYLHSIWDCHKQAFVHLDGAVKTYGKDLYDQRLAHPMHKCPIKPNYKKLFRLDGQFDTATWSDVIQGFYRANEMVAEYFADFSKLKLTTPAPGLQRLRTHAELNTLRRRKAAYRLGPMPEQVFAPYVRDIDHAIAELIRSSQRPEKEKF